MNSIASEQTFEKACEKGVEAVRSFVKTLQQKSIINDYFITKVSLFSAFTKFVKNDSKHTPLSFASENNFLEVVKVLLETEGIDVNKVSDIIL